MGRFDRFDSILSMLRGAIPGAKELAVAGGACRDVLVGSTPRDYDVIVIPGTRNAHPEGAFVTATHLVTYLAEHYEATSRIYQAYSQSTESSHFRQCYSTCVKVKLPDGTEVDVLFAHLPSVESVVSTFDSNLVTCYYREGSQQVVNVKLPPSMGLWLSPNIRLDRGGRAYDFWITHYREDIKQVGEESS